ncbi:Trp biosynthesis-associated membrane protein [Microbacterium invictum]|uniref:Membrane protein (TIGR02234 family) n=1 Tax=Microbacterium invictum TaxID=515415 RepID=A0AA40SMY9_9MICO|nr:MULTISPECIES: Trp biosynthesis-associated membrane protein [Microbacterium]MBB4139210.1 putative membrane protein (TIGR02234 family) [Microbacterium invictum]
MASALVTRARMIAVTIILAAAAVTLIGSTQTWLDVTLREGTHPVLAVDGATALPLLAPLSLAALALALALTIVGRVLRWLFGALAVGIGVVLAVGSAQIVADAPVTAFATVVTEATGLSGTETVRGLVSTVTTTPWPAVTVVTAAIIALGGVFTLMTAHTWGRSGRRFRTDAATTVEGTAAPAGRAGSRPHDAIDSWDDLSRGEDPTA